MTPHSAHYWPRKKPCVLTKLCLRSTYFMFGDTFFNQSEGAAMGSPLSPIVANLFMEAIEERTLESAALQPRMRVRYMDDKFVLWPHEEDELEQHLNSQHPSIQFTMEEEWREDLISGCPEIERKTFEANGYPPSLLSRELIKKSPSQHKETPMTKKTSAKKWFTSHMFNNFLLFQ